MLWNVCLLALYALCYGEACNRQEDMSNERYGKYCQFNLMCLYIRSVRRYKTATKTMLKALLSFYFVLNKWYEISLVNSRILVFFLFLSRCVCVCPCLFYAWLVVVLFRNAYSCIRQYLGQCTIPLFAECLHLFRRRRRRCSHHQCFCCCRIVVVLVCTCMFFVHNMKTNDNIWSWNNI